MRFDACHNVRSVCFAQRSVCVNIFFFILSSMGLLFIINLFFWRVVELSRIEIKEYIKIRVHLLGFVHIIQIYNIYEYIFFPGKFFIRKVLISRVCIYILYILSIYFLLLLLPPPPIRAFNIAIPCPSTITTSSPSPLPS